MQPVNCRISAHSVWMPVGHSSPDEARLDTFGPAAMPNEWLWSTLRSWWLTYEKGANTPNWDIAMACEIEGTSGLILVEAKANAPELDEKGKKRDEHASIGSAANHERIGIAIEQACTALRGINADTALSRDSHYQLSNRVAFAWKLASLGIPTVLVYLGFCGDTGIADVGAPFDSQEHWHACFRAYANSIVPRDLFERRLDCGAAPAWLLVRARHVLELSPARSARQNDCG
ncbi:MAG TPA: hypothetical protein VFA27_05110 [Vicinamibacterales bacterium]|nr:hypothetical protein [Vicinamibacterales bacterium]